MLGMKTQNGLTLVELMVTLAVAIILLALGVPAYDRMMANNRVSGQTNVFVTALTAARTEALGRGLPVTVCAKSSTDPASTTCGTAANWANGAQIFVDTGATAGSFDVGTETRLQLINPLEGNATVTASVGSVRFLADGTLDGNRHAATETFQVAQDATGSYANCTRLTLVGNVNTARMSATDTCP